MPPTLIISCPARAVLIQHLAHAVLCDRILNPDQSWIRILNPHHHGSGSSIHVNHDHPGRRARRARLPARPATPPTRARGPRERRRGWGRGSVSRGGAASCCCCYCRGQRLGLTRLGPARPGPQLQPPGGPRRPVPQHLRAHLRAAAQGGHRRGVSGR